MDTEENDVLDLLDELAETDKSSVAFNNDNIFTILNKERDERTHCRILRYLIDKYWEEFKVCCLPKKFSDTRLIYSECEYRCEALSGCEQFKNGQGESKDKSGSVDILLRVEDCNTHANYTLPIEVKIDAQDQKLQLVRYYSYFKFQKKENAEIIYLTLDGRRATSYSTECKDAAACKFKDWCKGRLNKEEYHTLSFKKKNGIIDWLEGIKDKNDIALQYYEILKKECESLMVLESLLKNDGDMNIAVKRFKTAYSIYENYKGAVNLIINCFRDKLAECLEGYNYSRIDESSLFDYNNTILAVKNGDKVISVCIDYNLYCRKKADEKTEGKDKISKSENWCYITPEWFTGEVNNFNNKDTKDTIDGKKLSGAENAIVKWYFSEKTQDEQINRIAENLIKYVNA